MAIKHFLKINHSIFINSMGIICVGLGSFEIAESKIIENECSILVTKMISCFQTKCARSRKHFRKTVAHTHVLSLSCTNFVFRSFLILTLHIHTNLPLKLLSTYIYLSLHLIVMLVFLHTYLSHHNS